MILSPASRRSLKSAITVMTDRRAKPRANVCFDVSWEATSGNYIARLTDLSEQGCYIDSTAEVVLGERMNFQVCLPGGEWLSIAGRVMHFQTRIGFGVVFEGMDEERLQRIRRVVETSEASASVPPIASPMQFGERV
jgi:hypothetical protein